jgi:Domain of unknown function (DUF3883)
VRTGREAQTDPRSSDTQFPANNGSEQEASRAFKPTEPPDRRSAGRRSIVVTRKVASNMRITPAHRVDEGLSLGVAISFESQDRYPVRVEHVHGYESLGCDIVSLFTQESAERLERTGELDITAVARFIEVKGRSDRSGSVELTQNQRDAGEKFSKRYYVYRVFQDPALPEHIQLAILCDPVNGGAEVVSRRFTYDFRRGSGAEWFELKLDNSANESYDSVMG